MYADLNNFMPTAQLQGCSQEEAQTFLRTDHNFKFGLVFFNF